MQQRLSGWRLALALGVLLTVTWLPGLTLAYRQAVSSALEARTVVAVFPPSWHAETAFAAVLDAAGAPLRRTGLSHVWLVHSEQAGFAQRLRSRGAWLVLDAALLEPGAWLRCIR